MATRAMIWFVENESKAWGSYNHYDGYPQYLGKLLITYFNTPDKAKTLCQKGYISYIDENGEVVSKYPDEQPLKRWGWLIEFVLTHGGFGSKAYDVPVEECNYIYKNGKWYFATGTKLIPLEEYLQKGYYVPQTTEHSSL